MRIFLWQQFSSNLSGYVLVGSFKTPKLAEDAAAEFAIIQIQ